MTVYYDVEPCLDCIEIHGDTRRQWLLDCPTGAEYHWEYHAHLCDGCYDERKSHDQVLTDP